jgi:aryl-alcohol dehydrogenase-like predicted oxidoreductase
MTAPLILGTAQFGAAYGITNAVGRLTDAAVAAIVETALDGGVVDFDTAQAYGDAEERLGRVMRDRAVTVRAITKFAVADVDPHDLVASLSRSVARLGCSRLDVLLHRPSDVHDPAWPVVLDGLRRARDAGVLTGFGVSVYDLAELTELVDAMPDLDLVQVPGSIVDRRLLSSALLADLAAHGVEVHVRSAYLQGLLLAAVDDLPAGFEALAPVLDDLDAAARVAGTSRLPLLLTPLVTDPLVSGVVVGATNAAEVQASLAAAANPVGASTVVVPLPDEILDPRRWSA